MGRDCNKVLKVDHLQYFVVRIYNKSVDIDVCMKIQDSKKHCQELAFNVNLTYHVKIDNGLMANATSLFSWVQSPKSLFRSIYLYGDWFASVVICESGMDRVGHNGLVVRRMSFDFIPVKCFPFNQCLAQLQCVMRQSGNQGLY